MKVLAIETSTTACSLGLRIDGETVEQTTQLGRNHSREILPLISGLLAETAIDLRALDLIVYGKGPGSFTGLRIALGVVQGLAYGVGIPVVGISTLACCAQGRYRMFGDEQIVVAQTARLTEVFFGAYEAKQGFVKPVLADTIFEAAQVPELAAGGWVGIGSAWQLRETMEAALCVKMADVQLEVFPLAHDLLDLGILGYESGDAINPMLASPEYIREQVANKPGSGTK